jgi:hypothetical protein
MMAADPQCQRVIAIMHALQVSKSAMPTPWHVNNKPLIADGPISAAAEQCPTVPQSTNLRLIVSRDNTQPREHSTNLKPPVSTSHVNYEYACSLIELAASSHSFPRHVVVD